MNKFLIGGASAAAGVGIIGAAAAAYVAKAVQGRATGDLQGLIDSNSTPTHPVVVFLGASIVKGRASVDFVDMVREESPDLCVINAGENGQTVRDVRERLASVLCVQPAAVVILIGSNDVQIALDPTGVMASRQAKQHGSTPNVATFRDDLTEIIGQLEHSGAKVAVCTLPPLGQDLASEPNQVIREFNTVITGLAASTGATCLDVYGQMARILTEAGVEHTKPFTGKWQPGRRSLTQHFIIGRSYDDIATREGLLLSPDYVHLNTAGAQVIADLANEFLAAAFLPQQTSPDAGQPKQDSHTTVADQAGGEPSSGTDAEQPSNQSPVPPAQRSEPRPPQPSGQPAPESDSQVADMVGKPATAANEAAPRTMADALRSADQTTPYGN